MPPISRPGVGQGRRKILLERRAPHQVVGWLEDDFHHFGVTIEHDADLVVTDVRSAAPRHPWTLCPAAGLALKPLIGRTLRPRASEIGALIEMRFQCTHMFDLAGLVMAQAVRGETRRDYHVAVSDREIRDPEDMTPDRMGAGEVVLERDGAVVRHWRVEGDAITGPAEVAGQSLGRGFREWTEGMDIDGAEYATIIRRALLVAGGRTIDHDDYETAADMKQPALCHSFQPDNAPKAKRIRGSRWNYEDRPDDMLARRDETP